MAQQILEALGLPPAPMVVMGVEAAAVFFRDHLQVNPMDWLSYLNGMDFHKEVRRVLLSPGAELIRYQAAPPGPAKPFVYFSLPGISNDRLGINYPAYTFERWTVMSQVPALESFASGIRFDHWNQAVRSGRSTGFTSADWDHTVRPGGGTQFIIAEPDMCSLRRV